MAISSEDQRELNQILMISQKVDLSTAGNAGSVYDYMTKKASFKSRFALLYLKRLKELSAGNVEVDSLKCICCGTNQANVNKSFCPKCFAALQNMAKATHVTKIAPNAAAKPVEKPADNIKSATSNESNVETTRVKADSTTDNKTSNEEKASASAITSKRDALYKNGWDEKKSLTYLMTVGLIASSGSEDASDGNENDDSSSSVSKSSTEIDSFDDGPLYRRGSNQEIDSFDDDGEDRISTGPKKKKGSCFGTLMKWVLILYLVFFGLATLNGVLGFIVKYSNGELRFDKTETGNDTNNARSNQDTSAGNQPDINIPDPLQESTLQEDPIGINDDISNSNTSVDFSVYDVTEEQLLDQLESRIENGITDETGAYIKIVYGERNTYGEENRNSYRDIINASGYAKLAQVGFKIDDDG
ncbi:MAG: hypothetical protein K6G27_10600, partial [Lachnospiraceae bacterium]|nr:hypothetical protein [Lachnospiraceae bacterium]